MRFEENEYRGSFSPRVVRKLFPFLLPYRTRIAGIILFMLLVAAVDVILPLFLRRAVDGFILPGTLEGLSGYIALYAFFIVLQVVNVICFTRLALGLEMYLSRDIKRACFVHLQELSFSYYNATPVGYMMARTMSDSGKIGLMVSWGLVDILWALVYVVGVFAMMFVLNAKLALTILLIVPFIVLASVFFQSRILTASRLIRRAHSRITGSYNEGIGGARTSKVLVIEDENLRAFSGLTEELRRAGVRGATLSAVFVPIVLFAGSLAAAVVLAKGGRLVLLGSLDLGTFSAFIAYALSIFEPIQQLARVFADFISVQASIERVSDLLAARPDVTDAPDVTARYGDALHPKKENWEPIKGEIEFRDVTFRYPDGGGNVLEHFSLRIPAGTSVAIVGETGAGKSTIVNLACRFFEPTEGQILIDGRDYRERSQLWLHSSLGYVLQNPHLFSGSIRENIRYGRLGAVDGEVEAAARLVSADRITARLPGGWDADVGEGGDRLSTGEKQLVSFARAILADPRILVLDEATSSVDTETERLIQDAIGRLMAGRTSFLIAHRLSTIRRADLILVVRDGKVIERGTHRELLRLRGHYCNLYTRQFDEEIWKQ